MESKIKEYISKVIDPRVEGRCSHLLSDILIIGLCTYLSKGEDYEDMVLFTETKGHLLPELLLLPNGVPSYDTFRRVFKIIDNQSLKSCLTAHGHDILSVLSEKQIVLDGKKLKGSSPQSKGNSGLYIVNAWVSENRLCIGQAKVESKSNEITAIPELLQELDITDSVVSIDAMGCQSAIAQQILQQGGNYFLAVKGNQKDLFEQIIDSFSLETPKTMKQEFEYDHGRFETRKCSILPAKKFLSEPLLAKWAEVNTIVQVKSSRQINDHNSEETRYYISNESETNPLYYNKLARGHWSIENQLHWHLDVTFKEDNCRVREGNAPENLSLLRKLALQMMTQMDDKLSIQKRRTKAAFDTKYLKKILNV